MSVAGMGECAECGAMLPDGWEGVCKICGHVNDPDHGPAEASPQFTAGPASAVLHQRSRPWALVVGGAAIVAAVLFGIFVVLPDDNDDAGVQAAETTIDPLEPAVLSVSDFCSALEETAADTDPQAIVPLAPRAPNAIRDDYENLIPLLENPSRPPSENEAASAAAVMEWTQEQCGLTLTDLADRVDNG